MKKPEKALNAKETLELLSKQWATTSDIMRLAFVGENKAREIGQEVTKIVFEREKKVLPRGLYPMSILQEYLGINISYLKKISGGN